MFLFSVIKGKFNRYGAILTNSLELSIDNDRLPCYMMWSLVLSECTSAQWLTSPCMPRFKSDYWLLNQSWLHMTLILHKLQEVIDINTSTFQLMYAAEECRQLSSSPTRVRACQHHTLEIPGSKNGLSFCFLDCNWGLEAPCCAFLI